MNKMLYMLLLLVSVGGCATHPDYATQFRFPINWGNIEAGKTAFVELKCNRCHTVNGVELPAYKGDSPLQLELGGEIQYAKTYADLVTSIINPDHVVSEKYLQMLPPEKRRTARSIMPYRDEMTVQQLIDIVTFLNSRYVMMQGYGETYYR